MSRLLTCAVLVLLASAVAVAQGLEVRFLVDDEVLIQEACTQGPRLGADPELARSLVELQARIWSMRDLPYALVSGSWVPALLRRPAERAPAGLDELLARVRGTVEYARVRGQAMRRLAECTREWQNDRERSERAVRSLTGLAFAGSYRVLVLHPAMRAAQNLGNRVLKFGGQAEERLGTVIHVWHEVLHDQLPDDDLAHVLIQLVAERELRVQLEPEAASAAYAGHPKLEALTERVLPHWSRYLARRSRRIGELYAELRDMHLTGK